MAMALPERGSCAPTEPGSARHALLAHRAAGRRDRFIDEATCYLAVTPNDPPVAIELLKALVEAGLGGPARELLARRADLPAGDARARLDGALAQVPDVRVTPAQARARLAEAAQRLEAGRPHLAAALAALPPLLDEHEVHQSADGVMHLSRPDPSGRRWVPSYHDPAEGASLPLRPDGPPPALVGTGAAGLAQATWRATRVEQGAAVPVYVLEDDPARLAAWLVALGPAALLDDDRVLVFAGSDAAAQLREHLTRQEGLRVPEVFLAVPGAEALRAATMQAVEQVAQERRRAVADLVGRHRNRPGDDLARRLRPNATILGFTSRFTTMLQYSMRDIGHAVEALGYRFRLMIELSDHHTQNVLTTTRAVLDADPALIVLLNHFRHEQPSAFGAVPLLTWVQDPTTVVMSTATGTSIGPQDFVCGYFRQRCTRDFSYPEARYRYAPVPASTRLFHPGPVEPATAERLRSDVAYVGHLHDTAAEHMQRWRAMLGPALHPLLDRLHDEVQARHERNDHLAHPDEARPIVQHHLSEVNADLGDEQVEQLSNYFVLRLYDIVFRRETLTWAAAWAARTGRVLRIFGRGWDRDPALAPYAAGPLAHGDELRCAYRSARLALQTTISGYSHQRAYEATLSGCLAIGRYIPSDFDHLTLEQFRAEPPPEHQRCATARHFRALDQVVFRTADELAGLADALLDDAPRRHSLLSEMDRVVRSEFTYEAVVGRLLEWVRCGLAEPAGAVAAP